MDVAAERELGGERQVGRLLLRREGGRMVRGRVGAYLAEMDQFVAVFDNGAVLVLDWDGLEGLVPLLPYAKQRESKPKETKEVQAATRGGVSRAKELAARTLRSLLITLVEANNSVDTDHKQNVLRGLKDRSLTHAEALRRFAKCRSGSMIEDAVLALAQAEDELEAADVGVGVLLGVAAAGSELPNDSTATTTRDKMFALWRWQKGVGTHAELEDAAEWGLRAWRRLGAYDEPKTEPKAETELFKAKARTKRVETVGKTKRAETVAKTKGVETKHSPTKTSKSEKKRPRLADSPPPPVPTGPSVSSPPAVSPPSVARPPAAETPTKKPRPLLQTAQVARESEGGEKDSMGESSSLPSRHVRFHKTARVLSFRADDAASAVAASPARAALQCSRTLSWS